MFEAKDFFEELVKFLPKHVSPMKSYIHASLVFVITFIVSTLIMNKLDLNFDVNRDGIESENEEKAKKLIQHGLSFIISVFIADVAFNTSWRLRNKINKNHATYSRWFKGYL